MAPTGSSRSTRAPLASPVIGTQELIFAYGGTRNGQLNTDQDSSVEEIQLQGTSIDERLTWQAGLYYEKSEPNDLYGAQSRGIISCDQLSTRSTNPADFRCNDLFAVLAGRPVGSVTRGPGWAEHTNKAAYFQATYDISDQWSPTGGLRYTDDETEGYSAYQVWRFPGSLTGGGYFAPIDLDPEPIIRTPSASSEEPTWLLGLDYTPNPDLLFYGKYARGYRQGSVNVAAPDGFNEHGPEEVDTYEVGAKTSFDGPVPGTFNVALFYNDFREQQIEITMLQTFGVGTTAIVNAGESTIQGVEAETALQLTDDLTLTAGYAYLDTEIEEVVIPTVPAHVGVLVGVSAAEGDPLAYTPEHKLVVTASYTLPVAEEVGDMNAGLTYVYTGEQHAVSEGSSPLAVLPSYELVNPNFNWARIGGSPVDMSIFATNLLDEEYLSSLSGNWSTGLEQGQLGMPRMYGMRVRYNF